MEFIMKKLISLLALIALIGTGQPATAGNTGSTVARTINRAIYNIDELLLHACRYGDINAVKDYLDHGADIDHLGSEGRTPLDMVAFMRSNNHLKIARILIEHGADIEQPNEWGTTPFAQACNCHSLDIAKLLARHGANVDVRNEHGQTQLICAVQKNEYNVVRLLIEHGADINAVDLSDMTSLMWAVRYTLLANENKLNIVQLLVEHGADVNKPDDRGATPLMHTIHGENDAPKIASLLIAHGADIYAQKPNGHSILSLAKSKCTTNPEAKNIVKILEQAIAHDWPKQIRKKLIAQKQYDNHSKNTLNAFEKQLETLEKYGKNQEVLYEKIVSKKGTVDTFELVNQIAAIRTILETTFDQITVGNKHMEQCGICFDRQNSKSSNPLITNCCKHVICKQCISYMITQYHHPPCPYCRDIIGLLCSYPIPINDKWYVESHLSQLDDQLNQQKVHATDEELERIDHDQNIITEIATRLESAAEFSNNHIAIYEHIARKLNNIKNLSVDDQLETMERLIQPGGILHQGGLGRVTTGILAFLDSQDIAQVEQTSRGGLETVLIKK